MKVCVIMKRLILLLLIPVFENAYIYLDNTLVLLSGLKVRFLILRCV